MVARFETVEKQENVSISIGYAYTEEIGTTSFKRLLDEAEHVLLQLADLEKSRLQRDYDRTWKLWHDLDLLPGLQRSADDWAHWQNYQEGLYYLEYRLSKIDKLIMAVQSWRSRYRILSSNGSTHQKRMSPAV